MGRQDEIVKERLKKVNTLRELGFNPYQHKFDKKDSADELHKKYNGIANERVVPGKKAAVAGRVMAVRSIGKIAFAKLRDSSGDIQIVLQEGKTPTKIIDFFKKFVDSGDIVGVTGKVFKTKRGELSVLAEKIEILTKSIKPLPEKWHGLKDDEEKFRKRYLDIVMDSELKELFIKKSKFWQIIRNFLLEKGFLEVETPVLEMTTGGAAATPFKTHHNALDADVYLRISMGELWQKKLLVAGYEKTFEIGRQFRNEGMDMEHLQDYTQMEFYWAYADYNDGMKLVKELYKKVAKSVLGTLKFETHGYKVDLGKKWILYDYEKLIKEKTGIKIYEVNAEDIKKTLDKLGVEYEVNADKWKLVDALWKYCRKVLIGPGFLINQPVEVSPLAKRSCKDRRKVEQFQVIIAGTEMGNGYSELNDPQDQEERFKRQAELKKAGNTESMEHDKSFVEALEYGMPPACGFGVSERFFSYLVDRPIRECVVFPLMKDKN